MVSIYRIITAAFLGVFLFVFIWAQQYMAGARHDSYPRTANYYLWWELKESDLPELAKWDVLILDMETQVNSAPLLKKLRELNPHIILLAYITSQEIRRDAATAPSIMRRKLFSGIAEEWYLVDAAGNKLSTWPGTYLLNVSSESPLVNGERFTSFLARFVNDEIISTGLWDGVFFDNTWNGISWFTERDKAAVDLNRDGVAEVSYDESWQAGLKFLFNETRRRADRPILLVGNGGTGAYGDELNGMMFENFPNSGGWPGTMNLYRLYAAGSATPRVLIINRTTGNSGRQDNYRSMRFGLMSALMGDGYYAFDHGDLNHGQQWWYDEYDASLGEPVGAPLEAAGAATFASGVWRREYEHGIALVNATNKEEEIDLGGEYEKIIGRQDQTVNDGAIVERVRLQGQDGIMMYKTVKTVPKIFFKNGSFVRFFRMDGSRARNGFFLFEENLPGGAQIYNGDLEGDGTPNKIISRGPELEIFNERGEYWFNDYPFGANWRGEMRLAINGGGRSASTTLIVAPGSGGKVSIYTYYGAPIRENIYPLGRRFRGDLSVVAGNVAGNKENEVVIGASRNRPAEVVIFDNEIKKITSRWFPFGRSFTGSISVAVGNFDGRGFSEIAVGAVVKGKPIVRIFSSGGKKLSEFSIRGLFGKPAFTVAASDINFEGKDEIVVMSAN